MLKILTIVENKPSLNRALKPEFGLSFLVEKDEHKILFDCGSNSLGVKNAGRLNVDLEDIAYTILSHSHFDHAGGYPDFLEQGLHSPLVTGVKFWEEKYAQQEGKFIYLGCGFKSSLLKRHGVKQLICQEILELFPDCYAVGNFTRTHVVEEIPARFKRLTKNGLVADVFPDEIALVLDTAKGLVVIVGCSHPGILNMLSTIQQRFGKKIYAVFGGSHLKDAEAERIEETVKILELFGIEVMGLNHCTGDNAEQCICQKTQNMEVVSLHTGEVLFLDI